MATFKSLVGEGLSVNTKTLLHEAIPITGSVISGTYGTQNIKTFTHGLFSSIYDYPFLSSSANQLFDMTVAYNTSSAASASANVANNKNNSKKKLNMYYQMSQVLAGHDADGNILSLDEDGNFNNEGEIIHNAFFMNFSRLLIKDEIKKGSFNMVLGVCTSSQFPFAATVTITDSGSLTSYGINSPVGEYGILRADNLTSGSLNGSKGDPRCGLIFYQAGVVALSTNIFSLSSSNNITSSLISNQRGLLNYSSAPILSGSNNVAQVLASGSIDDFNFGIRRRIRNILFNNTTEINSTIYFCRIPSNEFNYSSNKTYVKDSKIVVKQRANQDPITYFTTVGLYNKRGELMAVAKLSEPIRKDPNTELTLRVRLDY